MLFFVFLLVVVIAFFIYRSFMVPRDSCDAKQLNLNTPAKKRELVPHFADTTDSELKTKLFYIVGAVYHKDSFRSLARENPDWSLTPEELLAQERELEGIPKYNYVDKPVKLILDLSGEHVEAGVMATVAGKVIGYFNSDDDGVVVDIIENHNVKSIKALLYGGPFKSVFYDGSINVIEQEEGYKARIEISYY